MAPVLHVGGCSFPTPIETPVNINEARIPPILYSYIFSKINIYLPIIYRYILMYILTHITYIYTAYTKYTISRACVCVFCAGYTTH